MKDYAKLLTDIDPNDSIAVQCKLRSDVMEACHYVSINRIPATSNVEERIAKLTFITENGVDIIDEMHMPLLFRFVQDDVADSSTLVANLDRVLARIVLTRHVELQPKFHATNPTLEALTGPPAEIAGHFKELLNIIHRAILNFSQQSASNLAQMISVANKVEDTVASWSLEHDKLQIAQSEALMAVRSITA